MATSANARQLTEQNRLAKQDQIIAAAKEVLARDGVAACTARAVADASPLTKSSIHYYFRDVHEIVDRAVAAHVDTTLDALRRVAERTADPRDRLWQVVRAYLETFSEQPNAAYLWFEYWVTSSRRHSLGPADAMLGKVHGLLVELLRDGGAADPDRSAHAVLSWLLGTIVQQHVRPRDADVVRGELTALVAAP